MKRCLVALLPLVAVLSLSATSSLRANVVAPTADTYITEHTGLGGPTSNHNSDAKVEAIGTASFLSYPLYQFDLSSYAGQTIIGNGTVSLFVTSGFGLSTPRTVELYSVLIGWTPTTVTYNNFGATAGVQFGTDVGASSIDSQTVGFAGMTPQYVSWTVPQAVLQSWIDTPAQNHGLLLRNLAGANGDLLFDSLEGTNPPQLTFTVPEPSVGALLATGVASLLILRRRRNRA